jgi:hypothetical protein
MRHKCSFTFKIALIIMFPSTLSSKKLPQLILSLVIQSRIRLKIKESSKFVTPRGTKTSCLFQKYKRLAAHDFTAPLLISKVKFNQKTSKLKFQNVILHRRLVIKKIMWKHFSRKGYLLQVSFKENKLFKTIK